MGMNGWNNSPSGFCAPELLSNGNLIDRVRVNPYICLRSKHESNAQSSRHGVTEPVNIP
jgi:hypothetical protein